MKQFVDITGAQYIATQVLSKVPTDESGNAIASGYKIGTEIIKRLGSGLAVTDEGELYVTGAASSDVGTFYIDDRGHLMWKNENGSDDIDWGVFFIDERGHLIWKKNTPNDDEKYIVVNENNTVEFASDEEVQVIIDNIDLG